MSEPSHARGWGPEPQDTQLRRIPLIEVALVWHCGVRGSVWTHVLPFILT
jgi:hypothetical protein